MMSSQIVVSKRAGRMGVTCVDAADGEGAVITALIDGSSAFAAGLNVGDQITAVNGQLIDDHRAAIAAIDSAPDRVAFRLKRPTRRVVLDKSDGRIGVTLTSPHMGSGVLVSALEEQSLGFQAGLFVGDTILSVNGAIAGSHDEAVDLIDEQRVVQLVVAANTREVTLNRRLAGPIAEVGVTVADRIDGGAGVVVIGLQPGGLAIRQLQLGDVILSINGELVVNHAEAITIVDEVAAASCPLRVVVGERAHDLSRVLTSVHQSSSQVAPLAGPPMSAPPRQMMAAM